MQVTDVQYGCTVYNVVVQCTMWLYSIHTYLSLRTEREEITCMEYSVWLIISAIDQR